MNEIVDVGCPNCGWRDQRTRSGLNRDKSVACPRCHSLLSSDTAETAGRNTPYDFMREIDPQRSRR